MCDNLNFWEVDREIDAMIEEIRRANIPTDAEIEEMYIAMLKVLEMKI
jgi:hypothetical protein